MFESERVWPLIAELSRKSTVFAGGIGISWANVPEGAIMPVTYSGVSSPEFFYGSGRCESFYFHSRWLTGTESGGNLESPHSFFFFFFCILSPFTANHVSSMYYIIYNFQSGVGFGDAECTFFLLAVGSCLHTLLVVITANIMLPLRMSYLL